MQSSNFDKAPRCGRLLLACGSFAGEMSTGRAAPLATPHACAPSNRRRVEMYLHRLVVPQ